MYFLLETNVQLSLIPVCPHIRGAEEQILEMLDYICAIHRMPDLVFKVEKNYKLYLLGGGKKPMP